MYTGSKVFLKARGVLVFFYLSLQKFFPGSEHISKNRPWSNHNNFKSWWKKTAVGSGSGDNGTGPGVS